MLCIAPSLYQIYWDTNESLTQVIPKDFYLLLSSSALDIIPSFSLTSPFLSVTEGTLDHPRYNTLPHQPRDIPRWDPPPRGARTPSPSHISPPHQFSSEPLDFTKVPNGGHGPSHNTDILAYTDLPRVHDYPPSPDEDEVN